MGRQREDSTQSDIEQDMITAAIEDRDAAVQLLLDRGANVNARDAEGYTALMRAARARSLRSIQLLLERGADINAGTKHGETALMLAASGGAVEVVRLLLDRGADINATDKDGHTALARVLQQQRTDEDPDAIVEFTEVVDLLQAAQIGICI